MVQLSDDLVAALDEMARSTKSSRSALIREAIENLLAKRHQDAVGRAIVAGYRRVPQATPDKWGDLAALGQRSSREALERLDEEDGGFPR